MAEGLVQSVKAINALSAEAGSSEHAKSLMDKAIFLATTIVRDEPAIDRLATLVALGQKYDSLELLNVITRRYLEVSFRRGDCYFGPIINAMTTLLRLEHPEVNLLIDRVQQILNDLISDGIVNAWVADGIADLTNLYHKFNLGSLPQEWFSKLEEVEDRDPMNYIWVCTALTRIHAGLGDYRRAGAWLQKAVERASQFLCVGAFPEDPTKALVDRIIGAWGYLTDIGDRKLYLSGLRTLLRFVKDLEVRDRLSGIVAVSLWEDRDIFQDVLNEITSLGLEIILDALDALEKGKPETGLLPMVLFDVLEKGSRCGTGYFVGWALLANQILIKQQTYQAQAIVPALTTIEEFMREIAPLPGDEKRITA
jgi:hypothetical protein